MQLVGQMKSKSKFFFSFKICIDGRFGKGWCIVIALEYLGNRIDPDNLHIRTPIMIAFLSSRL